MTASQSIIKLIYVTIVLFSLSFSPAIAQEPTTRDSVLLPVNSPANDTTYLWPRMHPQTRPDPSWIRRTGIKKGIKDNALAAEVLAGPDAAVLKSGFFEPWQALLAEFREPMVLVDPGRIAGLEKTKPYLIVPSGALHGFSGSEFFKAGLAEYARSGGVIICFSQQNGADYSSLPVTGADEIEAAGWQQDSGPLFRSSLVQSNHPLFAGTKKTVPNIETSGYLISYPRESQVLLSRTDGFPTLIVYPYGAGWVVVSTMFSDFSYGYGYLEAEEKVLLRDIIGWAKSPARIVQTAPDEELNITLSIQGPELGEASAVKVLVVGPDATKVRPIATFKVTLKADQAVPLSIPYAVPADTQPGLYHIEYLLLDSEDKPLGAESESDGSRFSVGQPQTAAPIPRARQPLTGFPASFQVVPSVEHSGGAMRLNLRITPDSTSPAGRKDTFYVKALGQERYFTLGKDTVSLSLVISEETVGERVAFTIYHSGGRSLARGSVPIVSPTGREVLTLDKHMYFSGQNIKAALIVPGSGDFTLMGPGHIEKQMVTGKGSLQFTLPADIPSGTYRLRWDFHPVEGNAKQGEVPVTITGYRASIQDIVLRHSVDRGIYASIARVRIQATQKLSAQLKLWLSGPDGDVIPVADNAVTLLEGNQDIPITFTMEPKTAGIWQLYSSVSITFPDGPGLSKDPLVIATGRTLFDMGEAALIGIAADMPIYYEPSGPIALTAYLFGKGKATIELSLDNKKIEKGTLELAGLSLHQFSVPRANQGTNSIKATLSSDKLQSTAENTFVYGGRLPDLVVALRTPEPAGTALPVSIVVKNQGKSASGPSKAALYEGDPAHRGKLIEKIDVPALGPHALHEAVIEWPLFKKTGIRTLTAIADVNDVITEADKSNNTASSELTIPDLALSVTLGGKAFNANEPILVSISAANLTPDAYKDLGVNVELIDKAGKTVSAESITIPNLAPGKMQKMDRSFTLASLPVGTYQIRSQISKDKLLTTSSSVINILPTLMVSGTLDSTPSAAALCMPLSIQYSMKNAGNLPLSSGTLTIEIKTAATGTVVFTKQVPFVVDTGSIKIDHVDFSPGAYIITLKASAANKEQGISREFTLVEYPLSVSPAVSVKKGDAVIPRVLILLGRTGSGVRQVLAEKIVGQAFDEDDIYITTVEHADDFTSKFMSGVFNTAVLFETDELINQSGWLQGQIEHGNGLVLIGSEDRTRTIAEDLGFQFIEMASSSSAMITFTEGSEIGLSGTMPVRGRFLLPKKKGATPAALLAGDNRPAALIDNNGAGRIIVLPFSFTRSALDTGTTSLYGLLLRMATRSVAPRIEGQTGASSTQIVVSSPAGSIKTRVVETLPQGSRVIWANAGGAVKGNTITYELTADSQQRKLLYLQRPPANSPGTAVTEVFYECRGKFLSQGKVE